MCILLYAYLMKVPINSSPLVPSGCEATVQGGSQTCNAVEGAENLWLCIGRHWNLNLATLNARTLSGEASLAVISGELEGVI